ncbi:caspase family protein, partial [Bradyrhizobium sp.]|uniref:caspase family protein n=1 Tax=Bradyrhizobium sp. TaxID=376 RepID=UPI003C4CCD1A
MKPTGVVLGLAALVLGLVGPPALAQNRVALLIGNNAYQNVPALRTAINDAHAIADVLQKLNFSVVIAENQSRRAMSESLQAFDKAIEPGDMALLFFAGHGFEIHGENFLVPTDTPAVGEGQEELLRDAAYPAEHIIERLQARGARTTILVLDACRDNPFEQPGGRGLKGGGGLAPMTPAEGAFILFSAGAKQLALDRLSGRDPDPNSVFSRNLIHELQQPGLTLVQIAKRTQIDVKQMAATVGRDQTPAYYDQIVGEVVLN